MNATKYKEMLERRVEASKETLAIYRDKLENDREGYSTEYWQEKIATEERLIAQDEFDIKYLEDKGF
jgi:anaerobic ribonucleoside-triphosphate reductase